VKRFYKNASVGQGHQVLLDGRPVKTPGRAPLAPPSAALAEAIADEWNEQGETIDPRSMPLTGLANAAIDRIAPDPQAFAAGLAAYGESDLLYYRAGDPPPLVARQAAMWDPILDWARTRYDVHFEPATGIMHQPQPEATIRRLAEAVGAVEPFRLAPLSPIVTITGSLVLALALAELAMDTEAVWTAANLDEDWQAEQWGEDDLAVQARNARRVDFDAGARFLALLG